MYSGHFGLREPPFSLTPDTSYFLNRSGYQDALNVLLVALRSGEGFVKVAGEVGTGKTLLCRKLINTLGTEFATAYIHNPYLEPRTLLHAIADELGLESGAVGTRHDLLKRLAGRLVALHRSGRRVVLCLDEVQAMPLETLETLRLLTNLETEKRKLLQVVLFGQPELDRLLDQASVRQLKQRITFSYRLLPMNRAALDAYVGHRLAIAGYEGPPLFTRPALGLIYHSSGGIPRLVNVLCHKALMAAFGSGLEQVDRRCVAAAVEDTPSAISRRRGRLWARLAPHWLVASLGLVVTAAIGVGLAGGG
jgi:MSHA biogenesis protein MshM